MSHVTFYLAVLELTVLTALYHFCFCICRQ